MYTFPPPSSTPTSLGCLAWHFVGSVADASILLKVVCRVFPCQAKVDLTLLLVTKGSGFCKRGRWQEKGPAESFTPKKMLRDKWELRSEVFESARPRLVGGRVMLFTFSFFAGVLEQGAQSHRALGQLWAARSELQWRLNSSGRLQRRDKRQRRGGADSWERRGRFHRLTSSFMRLVLCNLISTFCTVQQWEYTVKHFIFIPRAG